MIGQPLHENWTFQLAGEPRELSDHLTDERIANPGYAEMPAGLRDALSAEGQGLPATVPGGVHTDLMGAGLIPSVLEGRHEELVQWIGVQDWRYTCRFALPEPMLGRERIDIVCYGLDTIAELTLNDKPIGASQSMHTTQRYAVKRGAERTVEPGYNELSIVFRSPLLWALEQRETLGHLPWLNGAGGPFNFIRKMACHFGWDWGPMLVSSGVWRPIYLRAWNEGRLSAVRPLVMRATESEATVRVTAEVETFAADDAGRPDLDADAATLGLHANVAVFSPYGQRVAHARGPVDAGGVIACEMSVDEPALWWPRGHGEQPLYRVIVELQDRHGHTIDSYSRRIGLRQVELVTDDDTLPPEAVADAAGDDNQPDQADDTRLAGQRFVLRINGREVFCKGSNWVPDDVLLPRACRHEVYEKRIAQAVEANHNMLRVWGGGIFESDDFYDLCDRRGVMVWQDFPFACAAYPEEEPFGELVEAEARDNLTRLCPHPSLVLWNGCNENLWGYHVWGWKPPQGAIGEGRTWGAGFYFDRLPRLCGELDPSRPYWPGSPFSPAPGDDPAARRFDVEAFQRGDRHPNDARLGNKHVWEVWFKHHAEAYRRFAPRFCSEYGFQGPATYATMADAINPDQIKPGSDAMVFRQRSPWPHQPDEENGDGRNARHAATLFDLPDPATDPDRHLYLLQVSQARALQTGIEWFRSRHPVCAGSLFWQLNDVWAAPTWSIIDTDGRLKPAYHAVRRAYGRRLFTFQPRGVEGTPQHDQLAFFCHNDRHERWVTQARLRHVGFDGTTLAEHVIDIDQPAFTNVAYDLPESLLGDREGVLVAQTSRTPLTRRAFHYFKPDKAIDYPLATFEATREADPITRQHLLTITAGTFIRDLCLFVDRLDAGAEANDQLITLLPGECFTFAFTLGKGVEPSVCDLTRPPLLQCVNGFA